MFLPILIEPYAHGPLRRSPPLVTGGCGSSTHLFPICDDAAPGSCALLVPRCFPITSAHFMSQIMNSYNHLWLQNGEPQFSEEIEQLREGSDFVKVSGSLPRQVLPRQVLPRQPCPVRCARLCRRSSNGVSMD